MFRRRACWHSSSCVVARASAGAVASGGEPPRFAARRRIEVAGFVSESPRDGPSWGPKGETTRFSRLDVPPLCQSQEDNPGVGPSISSMPRYDGPFAMTRDPSRQGQCQYGAGVVPRPNDPVKLSDPSPSHKVKLFLFLFFDSGRDGAWFRVSHSITLNDAHSAIEVIGHTRRFSILPACFQGCGGRNIKVFTPAIGARSSPEPPFYTHAPVPISPQLSINAHAPWAP
ncbi:hypothetical protein Purlil1_7174 [Purpureocillium lilacinum]|uniref:Uncharacterized protein n=1 Tax=Purpureocillium lilacinum TaxID=33203 RepID=A0ABR0BYP8_PURLI|nr:hypothetical protein Purlil1_7174 [Purpureocillium lilacinum]